MNSAGRSPRVTALLAAALLVLFVGLRIAVNDGEPSAFVYSGDAFVDRAAAPAELRYIRKDSVGYDGQFVYRLALDPLTRRKVDFGMTLDLPAYRQQRIALPALAWLLARASPLSTLWSLLLINMLALVAAAYAGALLAVRWGRNPLWGLLIAFAPGLVVGLSRGLTEPLSLAFLVAGLVCWLDRRHLLAGALFTAGILTRETVGVALVGLGVGLIAQQVRSRRWPGPADVSAYAALAVPVLALLGWQLLLKSWWGEVPAGTSGSNLGVPVIGVVRTLFNTRLSGRLIDTGVPMAVLWAVERIWLLLVIGFAALSLRRSQAGAVRWAWGALALLALSLEGWVYDIQFLRATNEAAVLSVLLVMSRPGRGATRILVVSAALAAVVCVWFIVHA